MSAPPCHALASPAPPAATDGPRPPRHPRRQRPLPRDAGRGAPARGLWRRLRPRRRRGQVVRLLGGRRLLPRRPRERHLWREGALRDPHAAAQRDRAAPHGPRAAGHRAGPPRPHEADAGLRDALDPRAGPCGHRDAERRGAEAEGGGPRPQGDGPRGVPEPRLGLARRLRRHHPPAEAPPRRLVRLALLALHDGRGLQPRRAGGLRAAPRRGARLQRRVPRQLGPREPDGHLQRGGRQRGAPRLALDHPLPRRGRRRQRHARGPARRHDAARDHPGRHGRGGPPRRRAVPAPHRPARARARGRPPRAHHRRRGHQDGLRRGRAEGHAGAQRDRLGDRQAPRRGGALHHEPRRHAQRPRGRVRGHGAHRRQETDRRGSRRQRLPRQDRGLHRHDAHLQPEQGRHRAAALAAVVRPHGASGGGGAGGGQRRDGHVLPEPLGE